MIDTYSVVLFSDGEEVTPDDLISSQTQLNTYLTDQILESLCPREFTSDPVFNDSDFWGIRGDESRQIAHCVTPGAAHIRRGSGNSKISLGRGALLQKVANQDGAKSTFIPFTFGNNTTDAPDLWTIANGDPSNPRIDLLQMALSYVDDTPVSRLTKTIPVESLLDLSGFTSDVDTIVQARVPGFGGDNISIELQRRLTGSGVTYSENGNAVLIEYEHGVSTVTDVEAAIIADSTLIEIASTGTGVNVLSDPGDTLAATHLAGGADALIVSTLINTRRRVQAVFSVKSSAPDPSPFIPLPDADNVIVGIVYVGAGWTNATPMSFGVVTQATVPGNASVVDHRMPLGVRTYCVDASNFKLVTAFSRSDSDFSVTATNATNLLYVPCPTRKGRLVGFSVYVGVNAIPNSTEIFSIGVFSGCTMASFENIPSTYGGTTGPIGRANSDEMHQQNYFESAIFSGTLAHAENPSIFVPVWTNGRHAARPKFKYGYDNGAAGGTFGRVGSVVLLDQLALRAINVPNGMKIGTVTFYVAEGL